MFGSARCKVLEISDRTAKLMVETSLLGERLLSDTVMARV